MEPSPRVPPQQFAESMKQELEEFAKQVMEAVNDAPDGQWIAGSEEQVRDLRPLSIAWITDELIAETRRVWSPHYGRVISEDEAIEILHNVKRFVELLWSIKRETVQQ
jgi:hypothetical protein